MRAPLDPALLGQIPAFAGVVFEPPPPSARRNAQVTLSRGERLFHQGDPCTGFYYVASGRIQLTVGNQSGDTTTVEIITEGETFGEAVAFLGEPYPVTATALAASTLYFVSTVFVDAIVATDQQTVRRLLANLSRRNHQLIGDIAALTLATARQRLSHYLLQLDRRPLNSSGLVEVVLSDPKKVIASRLNLTPEALSRTLRRLADEGLITVTGKKVQLMPEQLTVAAR